MTSSNAMEIEWLKRCLHTFEEERLTISDLTTDRHPSVRKLLRDKHPEISHWFDIWHVSKCMYMQIQFYV